MSDSKNPSIINKILQATDVALEHYMHKARSEIAEQEDDAFYRKSVYRDINYQVSNQGYIDRGSRISFGHLRQMAIRDTIVAAIIQTRQNQIASFCRPVKDESKPGFKIALKYEEKALEEIMEELFGDEDGDTEGSTPKKASKNAEEKSQETESELQFTKAFGSESDSETAPNEEVEASPDETQEASDDDESEEGLPNQPIEDAQSEEEELTDREKLRMAKQELHKRNKKKLEALTEYIQNMGLMEDRPFEARKWDMEATLRALVRDSMTYDIYALETVPDASGNPHHHVPVDGSTIRLTTPEFAEYKNHDLFNAYDILYPEKELEALKENTDAFDLDKEKLEEGDYKYIQVVKNKIERAFTPEELSVGMRNPTADIYANGYSISELELVVGAVTSHIFTENYNHSYYTQGFSAKGILHIKAPINRRKLETIRTQWKHMISGAKNSFQTPIFAGMDEVQWIPLTQNHSDMEFSNWMNYLIKVICAIYQIDPAEIGFGMQEEGGGGGLGGDNTEEKLKHSKDKGLTPLLRHFENFVNKNIIDRIDADFKLEFVGLTDESPTQTIDRQAKEVKFKKTINEIREDDGLPPIKGADDLILDPTYFQWFTQFHPDGQKAAQQNQIMGQLDPTQEDGGEGQDQGPNDQKIEEQLDEPPAFAKSKNARKVLRKSVRKKAAPIVVEYYYSRGKREN